jgi:mannose-1-phosphate guanylyltransferase
MDSRFVNNFNEETESMKAMILAAGFGTRLKPLTIEIPKPLVPIGNKPIVNRLIHYLKEHGVQEVVVNAHHHHQQVVDHLDRGRPFDINIEVKVESEILGTGGGIKNTEDFWDSEPFIVINGDILTNINLSKAYEEHCRNNNIATLILHDYKAFNQIRIDDHLNILDIAPERSPGRLAFTGIHIIEPEVLGFMPKGIFSNVIDCYRELISSGRPVRAYVAHGHYWRDMGTVDSYMQANKECLKEDPFLLGPGCQIHHSARMEEWAVIGENALLEEEVEIRRSILWKDVRIKKGTRIVDSIVTSSKTVERDLINEIY